MNDGIVASCPELKEIEKSKRRLIDLGLLHHEASLAGCSERYRRGETSHTIHVWWARRPHIAMRSLIYATVCKDLSQESLEIMNNLSLLYNDEAIVNKARDSVLKGYTYIPKVLDMFGGGGTIPYESLNLGLDSYSIDSNELSIFIQKSNLEYLNDIYVDDLISLLEGSGQRVLKKLKEWTSPIFPKRNLKDGRQTTNYLWTYSYPCNSCGKYFSLTKRYWISKKKKTNLFLKINETPNGPQFKITRGGLIPEQTNWSKRSHKVKCPHCKYEFSGISIKKAKEILTVEVVKGKKGKEFYIADQLSGSLIQDIRRFEKSLLKDLDTNLPHSTLPKWSGIVNPALYGVETHADIFNLRQRVSCLALLKALKDEYVYIFNKEGESTAKYTISVLSGLVDQMVDWNCRLSMWISQNEQVGRAFCGPGISMYWDFSETDPVASGPSNLNSKLKRIIQGVKAIKKLSHKGHVRHAAAQSLPFQDEMFDAIVTDPPYYDNIFYTILADNFYAWKRLLLKDIEPDLFKNENTNFNQELVASIQRSGYRDKAHLDYCDNLNKAILEAARVLKKAGAMSFIYSHSSVLGWEAIIKAFRYSPLTITSVQPLSIERRQRPRAVKSEAVNTCIAFIARKLHAPKKPMTVLRIVSSFDKILNSQLTQFLKEAGWCSEDIAIGLMAHGVALISNSQYIEGASDRFALLRIEAEVQKIFPKFKLTKRQPI